MKFKNLILYTFLLLTISSTLFSDPGKLRLHNDTKEMYLDVWLWNTRGVKYHRSLKSGEDVLIQMQTKAGATTDIKDIRIDIYYKNKSDGNYRGHIHWPKNINIKNNETVNVYMKYNSDSNSYPLKREIKAYPWDTNKDPYIIEAFGAVEKSLNDNNSSMQIFNKTDKNIKIKLSYEEGDPDKFKPNTGEVEIAPGKNIVVSAPYYKNLKGKEFSANYGSENIDSKGDVDIRKNDKTYLYYRRRAGNIERRQNVAGKTVEPFREIKKGRLVVHNDTVDKILYCTISNLESNLISPKFLSLKPGESEEFTIGGKNILGHSIEAANVRLRANVYSEDGRFWGAFEWNRDIVVDREKFTHVYFKFDTNEAIKLRRRLYKPCFEDTYGGMDQFLTKDLIKEDYNDKTSGGMGVLKIINKTGVELKIQTAIRGKSCFWSGLELTIPARREFNYISTPTGNQDNDVKDMIAYKVGNISNTKIWTKNVRIYEDKTTVVEFFNDNTRGLYRRYDGKEDYGKPYSEKLAYVILNKTDKPILINIRYSDLLNGVISAGPYIGAAMLTIVVSYLTLGIGTAIFSGEFINYAAIATVETISSIIFAGGILGDVLVGTAQHLAKKIATVANGIPSKTGMLWGVDKTLAGSNNNGFFIVMPKGSIFYGFEGKDIHDIKVTSDVKKDFVKYYEQNKFDIYPKVDFDNDDEFDIATARLSGEKDSKNQINIHQGGDDITYIIVKDDKMIASKPIKKSQTTKDYFSPKKPD